MSPKAAEAVDPAAATVRDVSTVMLSLVYLLPLVYTVPPSINVVVTASLTVVVACLRTLGGTHEAELLSKQEAIRFPIIGSLSLVGLFVAIKFLPKEYLNYVVTFYFCLVAVFAIGEFFYSTLERFAPKSFVERELVRFRNVKIPLIMDAAEDITVTPGKIVSGLIGVGVAFWYAKHRHFMANNAIGLSFSLEGIAMLNISSTQVGVLLLSGLFVYDIFWVFFTPVMVTVAKNIEGPIKLLFPTVGGAKQFNMLGLGDIVIPGMFACLMLTFDKKRGQLMPYFKASMVGYVAGLGITILVMNYFEAAQPALLYIVPAMFLTTFGLAVYNGEVSDVWKFETEEKESASADGAAEDDDAQEVSTTAEDKKKL